MYFFTKAVYSIFLISMLMLTGCSASSESHPTSDVPQTTVLQESTAPQIEYPEETHMPIETSTPSIDTNGLKTKTILGNEYYDLDGILYATELGEPVLGEEATLALCMAGDDSAAGEAITHIGDALYYILNTRAFKNSEDACILLASLLTDDYDTVGFIRFSYTEENYYLIYIEHNETFYAFDPFMRFATWKIQPDNDWTRGTDEYELSKKLSAAIPYYNTPPVDVFVSEQLYHRSNIILYWYGNTSFPIQLGLPNLTHEQADALDIETDYEKTAQIIATLADASKVNLGISYINDYNNLPDVQQKNVQAANRIHHLLQNDYDELGYVYISSPSNYYVLLYILQDGLYYMVDPCEYITVNGGGAWLLRFTSNITGCAEDFQVIADSIVEISKVHDNETIDTVHLIKSAGNFLVKESDKIQVYPHDTEVIEYYGDGFTYADPTYCWES